MRCVECLYMDLYYTNTVLIDWLTQCTRLYSDLHTPPLKERDQLTQCTKLCSDVHTPLLKERDQLTQCTKLYSDLYTPLLKKKKIDMVHKAIFWPACSTLKEIDEEIDTVYKAIFWPTYSTLKRDWLTRAQSYILILTYILHSSKIEPFIALDSQQMGTYTININRNVMTVAWQPVSFQNT